MYVILNNNVALGRKDPVLLEEWNVPNLEPFCIVYLLLLLQVGFIKVSFEAGSIVPPTYLHDFLHAISRQSGVLGHRSSDAVGRALGKVRVVGVLLGGSSEDFLESPRPRAGVVEAAGSACKLKYLAHLFVSELITEGAVGHIPVAEAEAMVEGVAIDSKLEASDVSRMTVLGVLPLPIPENNSYIWWNSSFPFVIWWELNIFKYG